MLEKLFRLSENHTSVRQELTGGITTFLTMSYIIFVQPVILSDAGMDRGAVMMATCLSSALATFLMAFLANYPIALAPAMGHNVFFTYTVCLGMGISWPVALGAVFISGVLFVVFSLVGIRKVIMDSIPESLKFGIAVGIGLMICLLGFEWAGVVVNDEVTLVKIGQMSQPYVWVSGLGLTASMVLMCLNVRGAILCGIGVSAVAAAALDLVTFRGVVSAPPSLELTWLAFQPWAALKLGMATVIFTFFILDLFDTMGTLVGVAELGGFMRDGELPRAKQAFLADSIGTVAGALMGTSTVTSYVESCSGITDGARTGLASVVTGALFLLALVFYPLVEMLGEGIATPAGNQVYPIIAPALIMVGFMMMRGVKHIPWENYTESMPAFFTIVLIGFSFSITDGIAFGFLSYTALKLLTGKIRDIRPFMWLITVVFILRFVLG
ncbi:MAG: NCS2 family permease [Candidatus Omnitrophica bacterium]|nr:NCS2 family permease [Candidatus Omnitrophota bacterium]